MVAIKKSIVSVVFMTLFSFASQRASEYHDNTPLAWLRLGHEVERFCVGDVLDKSWDIKVEEIDGVFTLDLKELGLTSLEGIDKIPGIESVENLFLTHNRLTSVKELTILPRLKRLWLGHNELTKLPDGLQLLTGLKKLCVHNNLLKSLEGIEHLVELSDILCLRGNQLKSLHGIESFASLTGIDIADNPLTSFDELASLKNLTVVYMDAYQNANQVMHRHFTVEVEVYKGAANVPW